MGQDTRMVAVGKITRAHGVRGAVRIYPYGETLGLQGPGDKLFVHSGSGTGLTELTIVHLRYHKNVWIVQTEELVEMDAVKAMAGEQVFLPEDRLPATAEGEYYQFQLMGLAVETVEGKRLGVLREILSTPGHDVYVVESKTGEILIPAVDEVVRSIDLAGRKMVIDPPDGLIHDL
ncbi:MAG: 16S rRNA processing protein RimM [Syntrophobacteraceae bacterium]|nr:16S rRNA processing protein RimM [Syntrophobacteraceae bacterium]